jgi:hypothetical protein
MVKPAVPDDSTDGTDGGGGGTPEGDESTQFEDLFVQKIERMMDWKEEQDNARGDDDVVGALFPAHFLEPFAKQVRGRPCSRGSVSWIRQTSWRAGGWVGWWVDLWRSWWVGWLVGC